MSYILVTGCNGIIGGKLTEQLLNKGYKVLGLSSGDSRINETMNFQYIKGNITDSNLLEEIFNKYDIKTVIHLAAIAHLKDRKKIEWDEFYRVNYLASKILFEWASKFKSDVFYASTVDVYGSGNNRILSEDDPTNPESDYAKSKYLGELVLTENGTHINYVIARLAPVYDRDNMKDIYKRIYLKYPSIAFRIGKGQEYHFVSLNNVIEFILAWYESTNTIRGILNVCDRKIIKSKDFINFEKGVGNAKFVVYIPKALISLLKCMLIVLDSLLALQKTKKYLHNLYKLLSPGHYSTERIERYYNQQWDLGKTVYQDSDK